MEEDVKEEGKTWVTGLIDATTAMPVGRARIEEFREGEEGKEVKMPVWKEKPIKISDWKGVEWSACIKESARNDGKGEGPRKVGQAADSAGTVDSAGAA